MGGSSKKAKIKTTVYSMGIHMGLAQCIDELVEIRVGDKQLWSGSLTQNAEIPLYGWRLFGGYKREGGPHGGGWLRMGKSDQPVDPILQKILGGDVPAFRNIVTFVFDGNICANSPYPKTWKFRLRRTESGWDNDDVWYRQACTVWMAGGQIKAMNPAHILYELWTSSSFRGLRRSRMDDTTWRKFADLMLSEGFGMCFKLNQQDSIMGVMQMVLDHTGAAQYIDRKTGLVVIVGVRGNYNADDLPLFTPDNGLLGIEEYVIDAIPQCINELIVYYKDPLERGNRKGVRQKNLAAIHASNGIVKTDSVDYLGLPTAELANRVARRDLNARSGYIRSFRVRLDKRAAQYTIPGGLLRITDATRGIVGMVLRIAKVDNGKFESGIITVDAALDAFAMPTTVYTTEEPGGYVPPDPMPVPIDTRSVFEVSYRDLVTYMDSSNLDRLEPDSGYMASVADRPSSLSLRYQLYNRISGAGSYTDQSGGVFCSNAELGSDCGYLDNQIALTNVQMLSGSMVNGLVQSGTAALLGSEIVRIDAFDELTNTLTIGRGCADTVPAQHPAGEKIWFYENAAAYDQTEYSEGVTLDVKLVPETTLKPLNIDDAAVDTLTFKARATRPYPPGNVKINNLYYPAELGSSTVTISWAHRNRLTQAEQMIDTTAGSITPEDQTTYIVEIYSVQSGTLVAREAGITGTEFTWNSTIDGDVRILIKAERDSLESWQQHELVVKVEFGTKQPFSWDSDQWTFDQDTWTFDKSEI